MSESRVPWLMVLGMFIGIAIASSMAGPGHEHMIGIAGFLGMKISKAIPTSVEPSKKDDFDAKMTLILCVGTASIMKTQNPLLLFSVAVALSLLNLLIIGIRARIKTSK